MLELAVEPPPSDGVTRVRFSPQGSALAVSSWSGSVGLYDTAEGQLKTTIKTPCAVLDTRVDTSGNIYSAGLDGRILQHHRKQDGGYDVGQVKGRHSQAARCLEVSEESKLIVSGGWDGCVYGWNTDSNKTAQGGGEAVPAMSMQVGGKVFAISRLGVWRYIIATSSRQILIYDIRNTKEPEVHRESLLKNQLRCVAALPDETGFAAASTEGRVAIERLNGVGSYTFKCHRVDTRIFPVNAISFHPRWHTFATGGADGNVSIWDGNAKKRICQLPRYETSIASLDFHPEGSLLAIAVSYTFEEGSKEHPPDRVVLRSVIDADVQPRVRRT